MDLALPPSVPTIINSRGGEMRPDNVIISRDIKGWITKCKVRPECTPPLADHFPIITHIDFPVPRSVKNRPWNFKATDWHYFRQVLVDKLETTPITENLNRRN